MKKKRIGIFALIMILLITFPQPVSAKEQPQLSESKLYSKACALVDGDSGRVLYGKNENLQLANASTTKILTCIIALEQCKMDEVVTVSREAAAQPKVHLGTAEGEQFYMQDLLYGLMLESYNDCAYAIAEHISGSVEEFAKVMNEKAEELGCKDSHFVTPNGLDREDREGEHRTTASDLCRIMSYCAWDSEKSEEFLALTQTRNHSFSSLSGTSYTVSNKNALLDMMDSVITGKTGYTAKAGYCYVAAVESEGRRYAIALLACGWPNHKNYRWEDARTLFGYGMENYHLYKGAEDAFSVEPIFVRGGYEKGTLAEWGAAAEVPLRVNIKEKNITFLKADWDEAEVKKEYTKAVKAPVKKGQKIGKISYCINGEEMYVYDICTGADIPKWDFQAFFGAVIREFLTIGISKTK